MRRLREPPPRPKSAPLPRRGSGEVIFEFVAVGNSVKVSAIDPATMLEVSIVGPVNAGEEALRRAARPKLETRLARGPEAGSPVRGDGQGVGSGKTGSDRG